MLQNIFAFLIAYFIGSVSFAWLAGRLKGIDLRSEGSGRLGARNVKRLIGRGPALAVLILDILKGGVGVLVASMVSGHPASPMIGWLGVVCGHGWPVFLKFRGGKGLASSAGALLLISPLTLCLELLLGSLFYVFTKNIYLSAIIMIGVMPLILYLAGGGSSFLLPSLLLSLFMLALHSQNIKTLLSR